MNCTNLDKSIFRQNLLCDCETIKNRMFTDVFGHSGKVLRLWPKRFLKDSKQVLVRKMNDNKDISFRHHQRTSAK